MSLPLKVFDVFSGLTHHMYHKGTTWTCEILIGHYSVVDSANPNVLKFQEEIFLVEFSTDRLSENLYRVSVLL